MNTTTFLLTETDASSDKDIRKIAMGGQTFKAPCSERLLHKRLTSKNALAKEVQLPGKGTSTKGEKTKCKSDFSRSSLIFINTHPCTVTNLTGTAAPTTNAQASSVDEFDGETVHFSTPHEILHGALTADVILSIRHCSLLLHFVNRNR